MKSPLPRREGIKGRVTYVNTFIAVTIAMIGYAAPQCARPLSIKNQPRREAVPAAQKILV